MSYQIVGGGFRFREAVLMRANNNNKKSSTIDFNTILTKVVIKIDGWIFFPPVDKFINSKLFKILH
jgi:hypothetical protein